MVRKVSELWRKRGTEIKAQKDTEIMYSLLLSLFLFFPSFNHTTSVDTQLKYRTLRCCQVDKRERERQLE